jgi:hypothetical protein
MLKNRQQPNNIALPIYSLYKGAIDCSEQPAQHNVYSTSFTAITNSNQPLLKVFNLFFTDETTHRPSTTRTLLVRFSRKYRSDTTSDPTPQAIGDRRLNWSTKVFQLTPRFHQTHLLWEPSSRQAGRLLLFRRGFELRCFQLLSSAAWLPGNCLVRQPVN